jgi:hypothetical protein
MQSLHQESLVLILLPASFPIKSAGFIPTNCADGLNTSELWSNYPKLNVGIFFAMICGHLADCGESRRERRPAGRTD